jgi:hypothetical protein
MEEYVNIVTEYLACFGRPPDPHVVAAYAKRLSAYDASVVSKALNDDCAGQYPASVFEIEASIGRMLPKKSRVLLDKQRSCAEKCGVYRAMSQMQKMDAFLNVCTRTPLLLEVRWSWEAKEAMVEFIANYLAIFEPRRNLESSSAFYWSILSYNKPIPKALVLILKASVLDYLSTPNGEYPEIPISAYDLGKVYAMNEGYVLSHGVGNDMPRGRHSHAIGNGDSDPPEEKGAMA